MRISDRFPITEWEGVALLVNAGIIGAEKVLRLEAGRLHRTRFIGGYLTGYSHYVDNFDEVYGAAVRKLLFIITYGRDDASLVVRRVSELAEHGDEQVKRGWGFGAPDGQRYFQAVEARQSREGAVDSLLSAAQAGFIKTDSLLFI